MKACVEKFVGYFINEPIYSLSSIRAGLCKFKRNSLNRRFRQTKRLWRLNTVSTPIASSIITKDAIFLINCVKKRAPVETKDKVNMKVFSERTMFCVNSNINNSKIDAHWNTI